MIVREVPAKSILSNSKVFDYTVNPYVGCEHGCTYCYARYMKRFTNHKEKWGDFVDVKTNAPNLLRTEIRKKPVGRVWISGVCDPYQPLEKEYEVTRRCLEVLARHSWPATVQTKSPLVKRDLQLLKSFEDIEVGVTITTADESVRKIFEPNSPNLSERIEAVERLRSSGVRTFVMIAPLLPRAEKLVTKLSGRVDYVLIDKMNYHYADWVYRSHALENAMTLSFFRQKKEELRESLERERIPYQFLF